MNPNSAHPRKRAEVTDQDVEVALLTGYVWGTTSDELCDDHRGMVREMKTRLGV